MVYFWLGLVIVLGMIEVVTVNLVTIWFVLSGIISLLLSLFIDNFVIQFGAFVIFGVLFMALIRKYFEPKMGKNEKTNLDRIIGMKGVVTEEKGSDNVLEVKVDGKKWSAVSNELLKKGELVKILKIKGVKLEVERWKE